MDQPTPSFRAVLKQWSALAPLAMSLASLTLVLCAVSLDLVQSGHVVRDRDEGSIAHIFQILMTVQMPIALFFAIKSLGRAPAPTLRVLALQAGAWLAACAPVYLLHL
jgi:hypothetical protein